MSIGKRSHDFASLSSSSQDRTLYTVLPVLYVLSINLGTPLFRLLKGFGTSASAAKWGPANGRRPREGQAESSGGAESGFAAIIRREGMVDRRSASGAKFVGQQTRQKRGDGVDKGTYAYSL